MKYKIAIYNGTENTDPAIYVRGYIPEGAHGYYRLITLSKNKATGEIRTEQSSTLPSNFNELKLAMVCLKQVMELIKRDNLVPMEYEIELEN